MLTDLRHALRFVRQNPGFAFAAAATLAIGIGANTAMFSVLYEVLLRPLPYERADRLVKVWETWAETRNVIAPANFADWQRQSQSFERLAAFVPGAASLSGAGEAERVPAAHVSADFFDTLRVRPVLGRLLTRADEAERSYVALVRESFWRVRLGGDPNIIGRRLRLDGVEYEVVGVVPDLVEQPARDTAIWRALVIPEAQKVVRGAHYLQAIGRLRDGVSVRQADEELRRIAADIARANPATNRTVSAGVFALQEELTRGSRRTILIMFSATAVLLVLACVNVAHLLLARGSTRRVELAVRAALGASRGRLVRQLLTESTVIALLGAAAGVLIALWMTLGIRAYVPDAFAEAKRARVEGRVLLFTLSAALATVCAFGLAPAVRLSRITLGVVSREQATHVTGRAAAGRSLIVLQVAAAVVLVVGAALLLTTLLRLRDVAPAFATNDLVVARVTLPAARYETGKAQRQFFRQLVEDVEGHAGVESAAVATRLPLRQQTAQMTFTVDTAPASHLDGVVVQEMSPKLLRLLGIPLLGGRTLEEHDSDLRHTAVVSRAFAERAWKSTDVLGRRFRMGPTYIDEGHPWMTVVGIVDDVRQFSLGGRSAPQVYLPYGQTTTAWGPGELVIRTSLPPPDAFAVIRAAVRQLDPNLPVSALSTMSGVLDQTLARPRFAAILITTFAAVAVALALVGIYGVIAYAVARRTREIGVRVALGATRFDVLRTIGGEGLGYITLGLVLGLAGSAIATRSLEGLLFGVEALDPTTYALGALVMLVTALTATVIPTVRALRLDPAVVLRNP